MSICLQIQSWKKFKKGHTEVNKKGHKEVDYQNSSDFFLNMKMKLFFDETWNKNFNGFLEHDLFSQKTEIRSKRKKNKKKTLSA